MLAYCLGLTCLTIVAVVGTRATLCPVSQSYSSKHYFHGYPLPIFYPSDKISATAFNCNIVNNNDPNPTPIQLCDNHASLCPIKWQNIHSALRATSWPQYVDAFTRFGKDANINVFYLGGSMTTGAETGLKCFCLDDEDSRCPSVQNLGVAFVQGICGWTYHISRWLQHTFPTTKFHMHDYAVGGRTSQSSDYFIDTVRTSNASLSNPALFFLDYSVNDAQAQTFSGLETLMRTIIGHFGEYYKIKPTIVVIEQYPHAKFRGPPTDAGLFTSEDYALAYRRISQHYNAVLISVREVFWTYFGEPHGRNITNPNLAQRYYPISPFEPYVHMWVHPPWYVHLYIADVLAACMERIMAQFHRNTTNVHANTVNLLNLHTHKTHPNISYVPVTNALPPPLYNLTSELQHVCNLTLPYIIDAVPPHTMYTGGANKSHGWTVTKQHNAPGWLINNQAHPDKRILSFPITAPIAQLQHLIVKVSYLLSYEGMGAAHLYLCGYPLTDTTVMDGLWEQKVSIPFLKSFVLSNQDIARCEAVPKEQRTVGLVYRPGVDKLELRAKHHHQFKLFDVRVCAPVTQ